MYRVDWLQNVEINIFGFWMLAEPVLQARISAAVNKLEQRLSDDPLHVGEGRFDNVRITFEFPLGVLFDTDSANKIVTVVHAWLYS